MRELFNLRCTNGTSIQPLIQQHRSHHAENSARRHRKPGKLPFSRGWATGCRQRLDLRRCERGLGNRRGNSGRLLPIGSSAHRRDKPIATPGQCLDVSRLFCVVFQRPPDLVNREVDAMLEIHKGCFAPQVLLDFLAGHYRAGALCQQQQNAEWLGL